MTSLFLEIRKRMRKRKMHLRYEASASAVDGGPIDFFKNRGKVYHELLWIADESTVKFRFWESASR